jgi:proline iminopeptidase
VAAGALALALLGVGIGAAALRAQARPEAVPAPAAVPGQRLLSPIDRLPAVRDPGTAGALAARAFADLPEGVAAGTSTVWVRVDATGAAVTAAIGRSSGDHALDEAALEVAGRLAYAPGARGDSATAAWVPLALRIAGDGSAGLVETSPFMDPSASIEPDGFLAPDASIAWWETGEVGEGGATIFFLHGGPGTHHRYLRPEWDALGDVARLVFYDQRGCGRSGWGDPPIREKLDWRTHVDDLDRLISSRAGGGPVVLFGSSWGSELALAYALIHPDRVDAIVVSGYPGWAPDTFWTEDGSSRMLSREEREAAAARAPHPARADTLFATRTRRLTPAEARGALAPRVRLCPEAYRRTWTSMETMPEGARLSDVHQPVLVLSGDAPDRVPEAGPGLAGTLPAGHLLRVEGAGHDPWFTHADRVMPFVRSWLEAALR